MELGTDTGAGAGGDPKPNHEVIKTYTLEEISAKLGLRLNKKGYPMSAWKWVKRKGIKPFGDFHPRVYLASTVDGILQDMMDRSKVTRNKDFRESESEGLLQ